MHIPFSRSLSKQKDHHMKQKKILFALSFQKNILALFLPEIAKNCVSAMREVLAK